MRKSVLISIVVFAVALLGAACSPKTPEAAAAATPAVQADGIMAEGRLMPANVLDHSFSMPGQVAEVLVQDGETVEAGQVLARLANSSEANLVLERARQETLAARQAQESLTTQAAVNLAQAKLDALAAGEVFEKAQETFDADDSEKNQASLDAAAAQLSLAEEALDKLTRGSGIDPDAWAASEAHLAAAQASLLSAEAAVEALSLKASMSGTVIDLNLQPGQRIAAGAPVITLADTSAWIVKTDNLTEMDVPVIQVGQKVKVTLDAIPGVTLNGEVTGINSRYEEKRGDITYTVTLQLLDNHPLMRWGMTAAVIFPS